MSVTRDDVRRIAELARLTLDEDEAERLTDEMNRILEHVDRLAEAARGGAPDRPGTHAGQPSVDDGPGDTSGAKDHHEKPTHAAISGTREGSDPEPDRLIRPPADFAPRFEEGFFVVPPPHGVQAG